ncbi:MAG: phospholipase D-like domain-containing protein [Desulfobulbaceae bacterium]|nr:phospholipase D-like domain-containing protein [Desulfobulbaceae bacterium]
MKRNLGHRLHAVVGILGHALSRIIVRSDKCSVSKPSPLLYFLLFFVASTWLPGCARAFPEPAIEKFPDIESVDRNSYPEVAGHLQKLMAQENTISDYPLVEGNNVQLLVDGPMAFEAMFAAIENAAHHIHAETFIIDNDRIGRMFADILIDRSAAGVEVKLIFDAIGGLGADKDFLERLRKNGVQLYKYNPVNPVEDWRIWRINSRHHRKILVVDGKIAFTGGLNISKVYSSSSFSPPSARKEDQDGWRDTHVSITGPAVEQLQELFIELWKENDSDAVFPAGEYFPSLEKTGSDYVRVIESTFESSESEIYDVYLAAISNAKDRIWITQGYFSPNDVFIRELKRTAARGVDVRLLLPGLTDSWITINSSRSHYQELLETGVRIFEREDALQHAKTAVVDGIWSTVGSSNLDYRSFLHANEANVVVWGNEFAAQMENLFLADQEMNREILLDDWRKRPFYRRLIESFASMFAYWL